MPSVLITYGLNPVTGLKLLINPDPDQPTSWSRMRHTLIPTLRQWIKQPPRMQVSLGTLTPDESITGLRRITQYKFFIAVETDGAKRALPALSSGRQTGIQVYQHNQGEENYKAQIVRFNVGSRKRPRRSSY